MTFISVFCFAELVCQVQQASLTLLMMWQILWQHQEKAIRRAAAWQRCMASTG
jgi:hypothetical protein